MRLKSIRLETRETNPKGLVKKWQRFLRGLNLYVGVVDGDFGPKTDAATKEFQELPPNPLKADGWVGGKTFGKAMMLGFSASAHTGDEREGPNWPPKPNFPQLRGQAARQAVFGKFRYKHDPHPQSPENIRILGGWEQENIVKVDLPWLKGLPGTYGRTEWRFHHIVAPQVKRLFERWNEAGLTDKILTWGGSYVPRFIRGSRRTLSNHAFGTAFDINVAWNGMGRQAALIGDHGSVRELVPIAHELGFFWGGHFSREDGQHFEVAEIVSC